MTRLFEANPFIIAEVGSNWHRPEDLVESIGLAKASGADAVKFQAFDFPSLYGMRNLTGLKSDRRYLPYELPLSWLPKLKEKADACGIELMCTAFSPELVAAVDPYVSVHKVASSDAAWPQMLEAVARTGKPVLLSTGAKHEAEILRAYRSLWEHVPTFLLYCVAAYPAVYADLAVMEDLKEIAGPDRVGFSDHTLGISMAVEACKQGANVLEKHVTFFPELDTPDRPHSLTPSEFQLMVEVIRGVRRPQIGPTPEEKAMLLRHNRRLIATQDIPPGGILKYGENFGAYRSLEDDHYGLSPFMWEAVEGRKAAVEIKRGNGIGPGDIVTYHGPARIVDGKIVPGVEG